MEITGSMFALYTEWLDLWHCGNEVIVKLIAIIQVVLW